MNILISGAGIAGLTLSDLLRRDGHDVTVVEKAAGLRGEGYMMDFFGAGYDVAEKLGMLSDLERIHYPMRFTFVDGSGREQLSFSYPDVRKLLEGRHFNFMRGDLERVLYSNIQDDIEIRFGTTITTIEQDEHEARAAFSDRSAGTFDLIVGADGIHSGVRELVFGPEDQFLRFLGYYAAAFIIEERPKGLDRADAFLNLTVPGRQVGVYPIRGERLATLFVYQAGPGEARLSDGEAKRRLQEVYGDLGWIVPDLLADCPTSHLYFDAVSQIEMPQWRRDRVVLVGDACQCVSLIAGQGSSMAMAGAYILADELSRNEDNLAGALARYQGRVKPAIENKQHAGRSIARWFVPESRWRSTVRNLVLRTGKLPLAASFLRRFLAAESSVRL